MQLSRTRILGWNFSSRVLKINHRTRSRAVRPVLLPIHTKALTYFKVVCFFVCFLFFELKNTWILWKIVFFSVVCFLIFIQGQTLLIPWLFKTAFLLKRLGFKQNKKSVICMIDTSAHKFYAWYIWRHFNWPHTKVVDNSSRQ